ncbi:hypothetical protein LguiB_005493 [Lonicera macranthoides]
MEVQVVSKATIKPSSSTPHHQRTFKISIIDKLFPSHYVPFLCFYAPNQTRNLQNIHQCLKESLSKSLAIFYPFAGRVNDDLTIDCNDDGVLYTTASVSCKMVDLLANPQPKIELFYKFMPPQRPFCPNLVDRPSQIAIQVNEFACGGIAIGICFTHLFIDVITNSMFVKCWSEIAAKNGPDSANVGICSAVSLFPQGSEEPDGLSMMKYTVREGRGIRRRFVFEGLAISKLKEKAKSERVPNPTRVEVVTCFIWKHLLAAYTEVWGSQQPSILSHAVNLRRQMIPKMVSEFSVGNIIWMSVAHYNNTTMDKEAEMDGELVRLVRESFTDIKEKFVPKLLSDGGYETIREWFEESKETCFDKDLNPYMFSSWCKSGLPDTDFGWGKPTWVSLMGGDDLDSSYKNLVVMMDGQTSDTIEAWVTLDKREMAVLELGLAKVDEELVRLVRESFTDIKEKFVPKLLSNGGYETIREWFEESKETCSDKDLNPYMFSSWCKSGLPDTDFGWGKPTWVSLMGGADVDSSYKNLVVMMDGQTSDTIEAWITLDKREMTVLERDPNFIAFASLNPPISIQSQSRNSSFFHVNRSV